METLQYALEWDSDSCAFASLNMGQDGTMCAAVFRSALPSAAARRNWRVATGIVMLMETFVET